MTTSHGSPHETTRLIIETDHDLTALNRSNNERFSIKSMSVGRFNPEGSADYRSLSNLSRTALLEIALRNERETKTASLPPEMLGRIASYIREKDQISGVFDCLSFVQHANGIPREVSDFGKNVFFNPKHWDTYPMDDEATLQPGDTIFLSRSRKILPDQRTHFAIHVGDGLYLSKFGYKQGSLIAASIEEMQKGFGGDKVTRSIPNPNFVAPPDQSAVQRRTLRLW